MGTNENSYGHALLQKSVTPTYENSVPERTPPEKKWICAPDQMEHFIIPFFISDSSLLLVNVFDISVKDFFAKAIRFLMNKVHLIS